MGFSYIHLSDRHSYLHSDASSLRAWQVARRHQLQGVRSTDRTTFHEHDSAFYGCRARREASLTAFRRLPSGANSIASRIQYGRCNVARVCLRFCDGARIDTAPRFKRRFNAPLQLFCLRAERFGEYSTSVLEQQHHAIASAQRVGFEKYFHGIFGRSESL